MNIIDRARLAWHVLQQKAAAVPYTATTGQRMQIPDRRSFEQQVKEGYYKNQVVLACIATRAQTLNEAPLRVLDANGIPQPQHPLSQLFRMPNKNMSQSMFWQYVSTYVDIGGNCYIHKRRNVYGAPVELHPYHSGQIVPISETGEWVDYYQYDFDGKRMRIPREDIIHIRSYYVDPLNPVLGLSPIRAAGVDVDTYNELMLTLYSYLKNNGVPSGVISAAGQLGTSQIDAIRAQFTDQVGGKNRGRPLVLSGGLQFAQVGLDVSKLEASAQFAQYETAICGVFRVHPSVAMTMAGIKSSTYSNMEAAYREFTMLTRVPTWQAWATALELGFRVEYPLVDLAFDTRKVAALQPDAATVAANTRSDYAANIINLNEARVGLGYAEDNAEGDKYAYQRQPAPAGPSFLAMPTDGPQSHEAESKVGDGAFAHGLPQSGHIDQTKDEKAAAYWRSFDAIVKDSAGALLPHVADVLDGLQRAAVDTYVKGAKADVNTEVAQLVKTYMAATGAWREHLAQQIMTLALQSVGGDMAQATAYVETVQQQIAADMAEKISKSIGTIRDEVQQVVRDNAGASAATLQEALTSKFATLAEGRAKAIATTTSRASASKSATSTWTQMNDEETEPGEELVKVWLTRRDGKVRTEHRKRDGDWVTMGGNFAGGTPGPGLGQAASDVVNCRCTVRAVRRKNL